MAVIRMIEAEKDIGVLGAEAGALRRGEAEMTDLHGRGLVALAARVLAVAFRDAANLLAADAQNHVQLDAAEPFERGLAAFLVVNFEHHCGDELVSLGYQWIIGAQLIVDLRLAALLDVQ